MIGSIAIDACVSQYASSFCLGSSALKLCALSCRKPVLPTRSTRTLLAVFAALLDCLGEDASFCASADRERTIEREMIRIRMPDFMCLCLHSWTAPTAAFGMVNDRSGRREISGKIAGRTAVHVGIRVDEARNLSAPRKPTSTQEAASA